MLDIAANSEDTRRIFLINLTGRIDSGTARDFDEFFQDLMRKGNRFLVLEVAGLEFVSSAGIASLVGLARKLHALSGAAAFLRLNNEIRMVLEFFGLTAELPAFDTLEEARKYLNSRAHNKSLSLELKHSAVDGESSSGSERPAAPAPAVKAPQAKTLPDGPRPLGAAAESAPTESDVATAAVPIQDMEADDLKLMIRRSVREVIQEEARTGGLNRSAAGAGGNTPTGEKAGGSVGVGVVAAGAGLLGAAAGAVAAGALAGDVKAPTDPGPTQGERMSSPPPKVTSGKTDKAKKKTSTAPAEKPTLRRDAAAQSGPAGSFAEPRVIKCEQCAAKLRVTRKGTYLCPTCRIKIRVRADGTAAFLERL